MEGYYHCEECNALFLGVVTSIEGNKCPQCGRNPVSSQNAGSLAARQRGRAPKALPKALHREKRSRSKHSGPVDQADFIGVQRAKSKRRFQWAVVIMISGLLVSLLVAVGLKYYHATMATPDVADLRKEKEEKRILGALNEASIFCQKRLFRFLDSPDDDTRIEHVAESSRIATILPQFYESHQFFRPGGPVNFYMIDAKFSPERNERVLDSLWTDGETEVEARFVYDKDEGWMLDWESYVRYAETSWIAFLAQKPTKAEEFRLYVRERKVNREKDPSMLSVQFYEPKQNIADGEGVASPEVLMKVNSPEGQAMLESLETLQKYFDEDGNIFPDYLIRRKDPLGMARVRVRLAFEENVKGEKVLKVREVLSANWLGASVQ